MRLASLALAALILGGPAAAQRDLETNTVTVIGSATVTAAPDRAVIRLGVVTRAATAADALRTHEDDVAAVLAEVRGFGIADRQISLDQLSLGEDRGRTDEPAYLARRVVTVQTDDLASVPDLVASVVASGANRLDGLYYTIANPAPLLDRALDEAVARARTKAAQLATAAGRELGPVLAVAEEGTGPIRPYVVGRGESEVVVRGDPGAYSAGESQVQVSVVVRFELL